MQLLVSVSLIAVDGTGGETEIYENLIGNLLSRHIHEIGINLEEVILITANQKYERSDWKIHHIDSMSYDEYSEFLFNGLGRFFDSEKVFHIQNDGFMHNNDMWDPEFLEYDYIGAPWPGHLGWCRGSELVGNGGFSIRSKKLYNLTESLNFRFHANRNGVVVNDDVAISYVYRNYLEENGIKFAPVELARRFAIELPIDDSHLLENCFGFHGKNYMEEHENLSSYLKR
jgi:hypothetical protein